MLVYLDTVICIYAIEGALTLQSRARSKLVTMARQGDLPAISDLTWLECRVKPIRLGDTVAQAEMEAFPTASDAIGLGCDTSTNVFRGL